MAPLDHRPLLGDSEATLRLVEELLRDFHDGDAERAGAGALPEILLRAYAEIVRTLASLRASRGTLEQAAMDRLHRTQEKLMEVSSATEHAATDMLDGLDRALSLVDALETAGDADATRDRLRDELHRLIGCLQFQDITAQQLSYASAVLLDAEQRLGAIATLFDRSITGDRQVLETAEVPAGTYDPQASIHGSEHRQDLADEIFRATR